MSAYSDIIPMVRAARNLRDEARNDLYVLQLDHIALSKAQKKIVRGDVVIDADTERMISDLRQRIAELQGELIIIEEKLKQIERQEQLFSDNSLLLERLQAEQTDINERLSIIEEELNDPALSRERREQLLGKRKQLQAQLVAIQQKLEELKAVIDRLQRQFEASRQRKQELEENKIRLNDRIKEDNSSLNTIIDQQNDQSPDNTEQIDNSRVKIEQQKKLLQERENAIAILIKDLFTDLPPQRLIEEWNDRIPVMLFPIRMETKFKTADNGKELWVRLFPDEIAIVTHEKMLTTKEAEYGRAYWKALWGATADENKKKEAWRMLTDKFGPNRSAWVALQTKPDNWTPPPAAEIDLQFPAPDLTKPDSWTEAPHTRLMPDRFVLLAYNKSVLQHTATGAQIKDILVLGPAPMDEPDKPSITRNETDNRLSYGEDLKWLFEFDKAVEMGMGFKIRLTDQWAASGFDQLLIVGLKHSADATDGKLLLEELIDNHHYSKKGLSLVTQGTSTNSTEEKNPGFSSRDPLQTLSHFVEAGKELFNPTDTKDEATDGQRLAEYLGIGYESLTHILNSDASDYREAVAMNRSLYAGTLGYYLHSMLNEVMDDHSIGRLRHHFNNYVTGRGPIAAIRVGNQPYGILPVSSMAKWKYNANQYLKEFDFFADNFYAAMHKFLVYLEQFWKQPILRLNHISKQSDAGAALMSILGLNPTSVEFFQRIGYSFDTLANLEWFIGGSRYTRDRYNAEWNKILIPIILKQFGYDRKRDNGSMKPIPMLLHLIFRHYHIRLDPTNLIDGQSLSEDDTIKPYDEARKLNYIHWLLEQPTSKQLEEEDFGGAPKPGSLLYMMLRHSLLLETSHSIYNFLGKNNIDASELIRSRKFTNITTAPSVSPWEIFDTPVNQIVKTESSTKGFFEFIHSSRFDAPEDSDVVQNLKEQAEALDVLAKMSTARLERTLAEHLDTLSYRLDAWQTSLFDTRLRGHRRLNDKMENRITGIYIGAYGYLENVKPEAGRRVKMHENILPVPLRENKDNLFTESLNGGYVHAPSLNHATAAAILRNGYLTHATPTEKEMLAVNLSSERVRRAMYLIDGIRNGQSLEVLLGYQFERGLHDWTTRSGDPLILNDLIPAFRKAFPIKKTKVPQEGKVTGPEETIEDFHVVNGLELARTSTTPPYIAVSPALSPAKIDAIQIEKKNIENTLDALRDILTSEGAYQLALGNFDRAAAVLQSISGSQIPPDIEVINTARGTHINFTNRFCIFFDSTLATNPWHPVLLSERALTEPGINNWIGTLLGDPAHIRCMVKAVDKQGHVLKRGDDSDIAGMVSLFDLAVQPIDFMYLIGKKMEESGNSELETRIRYVFAKNNSLSDATIIKIEFVNSNNAGDASIRSFAEILPFTNYIREIITAARALGAKDYEIASKKIMTTGDNPNNYNVPELQSRVHAIFSSYTSLAGQLETAVTDAEMIRSEMAIEELRIKMVRLANAGYVFAFPQSSIGFLKEQIDILVGQGKSLLKRIVELKKRYNENLLKVNNTNTKPPEKISILLEMMKSMLGDDFVAMPRFNFTNATEVAKSYTARAQLLQYAKLKMPLVTDEWLHGISKVRSRMHVFEMMRLLNDSLNSTLIEVEPVQLPYRANDSWLAVEFPEGNTIDHDTISFIQYTPQGFNPGTEQCGLLIDEWTESIPNKAEVTGITFHYNQPNSTPPQAILLTVTPEETGRWSWENFTDSILDTFSRAKQRAVEPDALEQMGGINALFPALISEFSTTRNNISLDYALNIPAIMAIVNAINKNVNAINKK